MTFANRIVRFGVQPADQFTANPRNPRVHPQSQRDAVRSSLNTFGWIAPVIVNSRTGYVIDGHERIWQALDTDSPVPFVEVDIDENEEHLALASFDWITTLAEYDRAVLNDLINDILVNDSTLQRLLDSMRNDVPAMPAPDLRVHVCPHCGFQW